MLIRLLTVAAALLLAVACRADGPTNPGFESDAAGKPPAAWMVPPLVGSGGWEATVVEENAAEGARCVMLKRTGKALEGRRPPFGNLLQCIDAAELRGKRITFAASVRYEGPAEGHAQLWLRVDREGGLPGFFDNMGDRPIKSKEWGRHEISGFVAPDATQVCLGLMVVGSQEGAAYLDGVSFASAAGEDPSLPPADLDPRQVANVAAFGRLYGLVRWYYPGDEAAAETIDWDALAVQGVREVEGCRSTDELAAALRRIFLPLAPLVQIETKPIEGEYDAKAALAAAGVDSPPSKVTAWIHTGFGRGSGGGAQSIYTSKRTKWEPGVDATPKGAPAAGSHTTARLWGTLPGAEGADLEGVWVRVPHTVYTGAEGTLPKAGLVAQTDRVRPLPPAFAATGDDRSTRLAAVIICWNVFQHFYPYFEEVKVDWAAMLPEYIRLAAADENDRAFLDTLRRMTAPLRDGHLQVSHSAYTDYWWIPVCWDFTASGDLYVTHVPGTGPDEEISPYWEAATTGLRRGDRVVAINGKPTAECVEQAAARISGSDSWVLYRLRNELRRVQSNDRVELTVVSQDEGATPRAVSLEPVQSGDFRGPAEPRPAVTEEVQPGVWYIDLTRAVDADFQRLVPTLTEAKGIIFDMRGYPSRFSPHAMGHFTDEQMQCARWNVPVSPLPGGRERTWNQSRWVVPPVQPRLTAKAAYMIDGDAISYAETYMGIVEHYKLGEIIGRPTAGANGNVNTFQLPGGYAVTFTGMRVLKHDGTPHHLAGIKPTIPVDRTPAAIAAGRDEYLEAAIRAVTGADPVKPAIRVPTPGTAAPADQPKSSP